MVCKILKKAAIDINPMSINRCRGIRRRHRHNCSVIKAAAAAASSIVLTRIGFNKGFKFIQKRQTREGQPESELTKERRPLPPLTSPEKRTVFLDLDETLVHSVTGPPPKKFDFVVRPKIRGKIMTFYVVKRPGVDEFLEKLGNKYEVVVFTAGLREYATLVLDRLDRKRVISHRLYRDTCTEINGRFVKDLSGLGRDLSRLVIVDDNPNAYCFQPENAVPIRPFVDDVADRELRRVLEFFEDEETRSCDDIRDAVRRFVGYHESITSSSDDDDGADDGDGLELELELMDATWKLPVLIVSSKAREITSRRKFQPFGIPILEFRTRMVVMFCLFLLLLHVMCFRRASVHTFF
ncbi:uncharacterized protein [Malus domestica]|uniref:uncharacterized protein n=1 Tax=Malus domestica TaxID=3750 RepID=UPI0039761692